MYTRICPKCGCVIEYKTKGGLYSSTRINAKCRKCASLETGFTQRYATKGKNIGKDNIGFGKKLSKEHIEALKKADKKYTQTDKFRQKMSTVTSGKQNPMYGRKVYDIWVKKYGKEIADQKMSDCKKKHSNNNSGIGNPMYGKPTPKGAGNGWKGWYKGFYFRSLRELTFVLQLEESKTSWVSGESIKIEYEFLGTKRTYRPDFIIGSRIIEIKPTKLHNTPNVQAKMLAAIGYCATNSLSYQLIDVTIDKELILKYIESIKFDKRYEEKFYEWTSKNYKRASGVGEIDISKTTITSS